MAPSNDQSYCRGPHRAPTEPPRKGHVPYWLLRGRARPQNRIAAYVQGIVAPWGLPPCKYETNLAVARGTLYMQWSWPASICGTPSGYFQAPKTVSKKLLNFEAVWRGALCPHSMWPRHPTNLQAFELATHFVAPSECQSVCVRDLRKAVVVFALPSRWPRGPCRHVGIQAGGNVRWLPLMFITSSTWPRGPVKMQ